MGLVETFGRGLVALVAFIGGSTVTIMAVGAFSAITMSAGLGSVGFTLSMLFGMLGGVFTAGWVLREVDD